MDESEKLSLVDSEDNIDRIEKIDFAIQNSDESVQFPKSVSFIIGNEFCER